MTSGGSIPPALFLIMYHSFLICFHENQINLYENGRPIGIIKDKFEPHQITLPDGLKKAIEVNKDLLDRVRATIDMAANYE